MIEQWREVKGYEGFYAVSNIGSVKSLRRTISRVGGKPRTLPERMMTGSVKSNGYLHVSLRKPGELQLKRHVHRLVAEAFLPLVAGQEVNHIDGNKLNNCVSNLEWCTRAENMAHAWDSGLAPFQRRVAQG